MNSITCKVILLGESDVGKTIIISRFINGNFDSNSISSLSTAYKLKTLYLSEYNKNINFEIWDSAGQEKFRSLVKIFYKNANACILVYDITNRRTFEELKNYWIKQVKTYCPPNIGKIFSCL